MKKYISKIINYFFIISMKQRFLFNMLSRYVLPRKHLFTLSNLCNANCVFCAYQYNQDKITQMEMKVFEDIIKAIDKLYMNTNIEPWLSLTPTVGDPLTDPKIIKKIHYATSKFKNVILYANGILLNKYADQIIQSNLKRLEISLADFDRNEYKKIYAVDKYNSVFNGLINILDQNQNKLEIDINLSPSRNIIEIKNSIDYKRIAKYLSNKVTMSYIELFDNWTGLIKQEDLPDGMKLKEDLKNDYKLPSSRLFDIMYYPNGDIRLCGCRFNGTYKDELIIGNISDGLQLKDILRSDKVYEIRNSFYTENIPNVCKNCSLYSPVSYDILKRISIT